MTTEILAPKIPEKLPQEKIESKELAYDCQSLSVKEVREAGPASPIIHPTSQ